MANASTRGDGLVSIGRRLAPEKASDRRSREAAADTLRILEQLQLLEGQDMALISAEELRSGAIWSPKLGCRRPLVDGQTLDACLADQALGDLFALGRDGLAAHPCAPTSPASRKAA